MIIGPSAGKFFIKGGTDSTLIGNVGDNLKTRTSFGPESLTAFGRLKASLPSVIYEFNFIENARLDLFDTSVSNGGTVTYDQQEATRNLNVTTANGSQAVLQTFQRIKYTPGQQNSVIMVNQFQPKANVTQEMSYADALDGFYFRMTGLTFSVGIRSSVSGSVVENNVPQSSFNGDKLDGTGESGATADFTKPIIFFVQFQWLGAGAVYFWAAIGDKLILMHTILHSNLISSTKYMRNATLPLRYRITNTGATASATTLKVSCGASISEGTSTFFAQKRFVKNQTEKSLSSNGSFVPLVAIRLKALSLTSNLNPIKASVFSASLDGLLFEIVKGGTLTGGTWTDVDAQSSAQVNLSATAHTGGIILDGDFVAADLTATYKTIGNAQKIGKFINGDSEILVLRARSLNNNADCFGALSFEEIF
tara:strand:- start:20551 stop:21816 length:1266 start_codon:yes stop_codon:yes gene_type:complete